MKYFSRYIIGALVTLAIVFIFRACSNDKKDREQLISETALIEKQINNVSKLVVTEMSYAKVYTYENTKTYGWDFFTSEKRALIISNAQAQIAYDLKALEYDIDAASKTIYLTYIPKPEVKVDPNLTFYNLDNGVLNRFEAKDFNSIKIRAKRDIESKISNDVVMKNAQNRLLSELSGIYILSSSMGWKLVYNDTEINSTKEMNSLLD